MKKLLALVLALVMTMGLATVGASAAFADADKVDSKYAEAVDLASMLGIIEGNGDNTFAPNRVLTRGEAAKFIAYLDLGKEAADALSKSETRFSDVPTGKWYTGYITYCADQGYITGYGNGKFGLTDKLTGNAFGAYVLAVLGYDRKSEGMTGSKWQSGVSRLLSATGIGDSIAKAGTAKLTRQEAAQYIEDALKTEMVEYVGGLNVTTPDGTQVSNTVRATPRANKSSNLTNNLDSFAGSTADTLQLGEKLYRGQLKYDAAGYDKQGRPTVGWSLGSSKTTATASKAALTVTKAYASEDALDAELKAAGLALDTTVTVYTNGDDANPATSVAKASVAALTGNGTKVEFYTGSNGKVDRVLVFEEQYAKLGATAVTDATSSAPRYVTLGTLVNKPVGPIYYVSDTLAAGDRVVFTYDADNDTDTTDKVNGTYALSLDVVTTVKGTYDRLSADASTVTIGGTPYTLAAAYAGGLSTFGNEYNVYFDKYGYVIAAEEVTAAAAADAFLYAVAYQIKAGSADLTSTSSDAAYVKAIFTDGSVKTINLAVKSSDRTISLPQANGTVDTTYAISGDANMTPVGTWFAYSVNSDGLYTLSAASSKASAYVTDTDVAFTGKTQAFSAGSTPNTYYLSSDTEIVIVDNSSSYKVTKDTGYGKNGWTLDVDAVTNAVLITHNAKGIVTGIYAVGQTAGSFTSSTTTATYAYSIGKDSDIKDGSTWIFAVNGSQVKYDIHTDNLSPDDMSVYTISTDATHDKFYKAEAVETNTGTVAYVDGTQVIIGSTTYTLASDAKIYNMYTTTKDNKGKTLTALEVGDSVVYVGNNSTSTLTNIWVTKKAE